MESLESKDKLFWPRSSPSAKRAGLCNLEQVLLHSSCRYPSTYHLPLIPYPSFSLASQRHHRIHFRRSPSGQPASEQGDEAQQRRHTRECQWVGWFDFVKQTLEN